MEADIVQRTSNVIGHPKVYVYQTPVSTFPFNAHVRRTQVRARRPPPLNAGAASKPPSAPTFSSVPAAEPEEQKSIPLRLKDPRFVDRRVAVINDFAEFTQVAGVALRGAVHGFALQPLIRILYDFMTDMETFKVELKTKSSAGRTHHPGEELVETEFDTDALLEDILAGVDAVDVSVEDEEETLPDISPTYLKDKSKAEVKRVSFADESDFPSTQKPAAKEKPSDQPSLMDDLRKDMGTLESELKSKLEAELRSELESELKSELESELKSKLESELKSELESELKSKLESELKSKLDELKSKLESELKSKLDELKSELESELKSKLESELKSELAHRKEIWEEIGFVSREDFEAWKAWIAAAGAFDARTVAKAKESYDALFLTVAEFQKDLSHLKSKVKRSWFV